jgi:5-formyltetrahydrofolate cyclo-ligase
MEAKRLLRSRLVAARAERHADEIAAAGRALATHAASLWRDTSMIAAHAGVGTEPPTRAALDLLRAAGVAIVLPVVDGPELRWAPYSGWDALQPGPWALLQPTGRAIPGDALASVDLVLVPALAVDRAGHRLGRGGGYIDRALAQIEPARAVAVVFDDEVLEAVPVEPHDRSVGAVLTPSGLMTLAET